MKILIIGAQGSGKGTQGQILAEKLGCEYDSLGEMLRADPEMRAKLATGELLSDAEVDDLALAKYQAEGDLVFDGYPRRRSQAETLVQAGVKLDLVIEIIVPEEEIIQRMLLRGREDDTEPAIRRRLEQYYAERDAVVTVLEQSGTKVVQVDGVGTPEEVGERVWKVVSAFVSED